MHENPCIASIFDDQSGIWLPCEERAQPDKRWCYVHSNQLFKGRPFTRRKQRPNTYWDRLTIEQAEAVLDERSERAWLAGEEEAIGQDLRNVPHRFGSPNGAGYVTLGTWLAHRYIWERYHGPVVAPVVIGHRCHDLAAHAGLCRGGRCRHRSCTELSHLVAHATQGDNIRSSPLVGRS